MKKTLTINISGRVFHIEEDAFEKLQDYLRQLNQYFGNQNGGQEILQDIEARIAEILQGKMADGQEAVTEEWVEELIQRMGRPEDFQDAETEGVSEKAPEQKVAKTKKRLYRDGESRVLGGVCSGMSVYFNIDPVFLRILFVLLVILGAGISVIIYLILWVVVPKARTTAQRLEMRGEEATITNIQRTIQEEVKEVKESFTKINNSDAIKRGKDLAGKAGQASKKAVRGMGQAAAAVFGSLLILIGFVGFVSVMVSLAIGNSVIHGSTVGLSPDITFSGLLGYMVSPGMVSVILLLSVLVIGIPLLAILFVGTKLVFRYKTNNKLIGLGTFGLWLVALILLITFSVSQFSNFSQKNTVSASQLLPYPSCKTLYLEMNDSQNLQENLGFEDYTLIAMNGINVLAGNPCLRVEPTESGDFSVVVRKQSRGKDEAEVQKNLENISYQLVCRDSTLVFDRFFTIGDQNKWRNQEVQVTVRVPKGKSVHLGKNLDQLRFDFDNVNNLWGQDMVGKKWKMTDEGLALNE